MLAVRRYNENGSNDAPTAANRPASSGGHQAGLPSPGPSPARGESPDLLCEPPELLPPFVPELRTLSTGRLIGVAPGSGVSHVEGVGAGGAPDGTSMTGTGVGSSDLGVGSGPDPTTVTDPFCATTAMFSSASPPCAGITLVIPGVMLNDVVPAARGAKVTVASRPGPFGPHGGP